jgi:hypothetical protein
VTAPQDVQGPWYVTDGDYLRVREEASDAVIATIEDGGHPEIEIFDAQERERHARLIAAAPDFIEPADDAADLLERYAEYIRSSVKADDLERHPYLPSIEDAARGLRAAIAKARGAA